MCADAARVSTDDQDLVLQCDGLNPAGCSRIFTDTLSEPTAERLGLRDAFDHGRVGKRVGVWRLDRLGRTLTNLGALKTVLDEKKAPLRVSPSRSTRPRRVGSGLPDQWDAGRR